MSVNRCYRSVRQSNLRHAANSLLLKPWPNFHHRNVARISCSAAAMDDQQQQQKQQQHQEKSTSGPVPRTVLSGIQPTGVPHLGNYLGALQNWVKLQDDIIDQHSHRVLYSIVDLHALTVPQDPKALREATFDMAMSLLACGIDPSKSILFRQSKVPQHAELGWLFFCRTPVSWLSRMHQWKSKLWAMKPEGSTSSHAQLTINLMDTTSSPDDDFTRDAGSPTSSPTEGLCVGLLAYPVLQAADILIYKSTEVPIGEDQVQHMNLTSMIARSFNSHYKRQVFPVPKGIFASEDQKRIMSLTNPTSKMSKSDPSAQSRINLDDTPDQIRSKIRKATTDSIMGVSFDPTGRPGVANLLRILSAFSHGKSPEVLASEFAGVGNQKFKEAVAEAVVEGLSPVRKELVRLRGEKGYVESVLVEGEDRARKIAERTLSEVRKVVGL